MIMKLSQVIHQLQMIEKRVRKTENPKCFIAETKYPLKTFSISAVVFDGRQVYFRFDNIPEVENYVVRVEVKETKINKKIEKAENTQSVEVGD